MTDKSPAAKKPQKPENRDRQIEELTAALQRERADAINIRRQYETQLASVRQFSLIKAVNELLPAIDNLERSLHHVPEDLKDHDYVKGIAAVVKQFEKTLSDLGITKIKTVGEPFDPRYHEAVQMDDSEGGTKEVVSEELRPGYLLGDDVIRHAMVKVRFE